MIQLYTGVPGSGKSYKMVHDLDKFIKANPDINLICNIENFQLLHINFDDFLLECFPEPSLSVSDRIERFFNFDYQKSLNTRFGGPIFYVLDECQAYFPRRKSLPNTEDYLQRHRHIGHHLYLATQSSKLINSGFVPLIELEYYAVRRSVSLFGEFHYRCKSPQSNQIISKHCLRPKQHIFDLYKSFTSDEISRPKRTVWRKFIIPVLLMTVGGYFSYTNFFDVENRLARMGIDTTELTSTPAESESTVLSSLSGKIEEPQYERVFLTIIKTGDRFLTVDPDTNRVVDVRSLISAKIPVINCSSDDLNCYYDRLVGSGIVIAGNSFAPKSSSSRSNNNPNYLLNPNQFQQFPIEEKPVAGPGNFIAGMTIPPPEKIIGGVNVEPVTADE